MDSFGYKKDPIKFYDGSHFFNSTSIASLLKSFLLQTYVSLPVAFNACMHFLLSHSHPSSKRKFVIGYFLKFEHFIENHASLHIYLVFPLLSCSWVRSHIVKRFYYTTDQTQSNSKWLKFLVMPAWLESNNEANPIVNFIRCKLQKGFYRTKKRAGPDSMELGLQIPSFPITSVQSHIL